MSRRLELRVRNRSRVISFYILVSLCAACLQAQNASSERVFPQSKATIEKALKTIQASTSGHLPVLDGFAAPAEHPLDRYQRGYYQSTVQVSATSSGGSLVRVSTKVTAWYSDPIASRSGYQLLTSNGRLETDLLDQLAEQLAKSQPESGKTPEATSSSKPAPGPIKRDEAKISAPTTRFPQTGGTFSSSLKQGLSAQEHDSLPSTRDKTDDKDHRSLQTEAQNLEDLLKNQAHPRNLVAVKKSGTPVVSTPSLTAKPLFLASMHDEYEMLDFNADWVHVRISGLSRGWIWRNSLEMPEGIPDTDTHAGPAQAPAADLFHVIREEAAPFPADWEPLRGKSVKIVSVQKIDEGSKDSDPKQKLEYAKYLLDKSYRELAQNPQGMAGVVLIFDSADGGMIAAPLATLQQWKAGTLSDSALWHKCFFDPPEMLNSAGSSASQ